MATPQIYVSAAPALGWATVLSPLLTMAILLRLSGIPSAEGDNQLRFMRTPQQAAAYAAYRGRTSPLIPLPPAVYANVPSVLQQWLLFEWKIYEATSPAQAMSPTAALLPAAASESTSLKRSAS